MDDWPLVDWADWVDWLLVSCLVVGGFSKWTSAVRVRCVREVGWRRLFRLNVIKYLIYVGREVTVFLAVLLPPAVVSKRAVKCSTTNDGILKYYRNSPKW